MNKTTERLLNMIEQISEEERLDFLEVLEKRTSSRRSHDRIRFYAVIDYSVDGRFYKDFSRDISESGAFITSEASFFIGKEVSMTFQSLKKKHFLKIAGTVSRVSSEGFGVKFSEFKELDKNKEHLKALVQLLQE